jgi:phage shock protein C
MAKQLTRLPEDKIVLGICSGVAKYFELDKTLIRLLFILAVFITGVFPLVIVYFIAYFIMPVEKTPNTNDFIK